MATWVQITPQVPGTAVVAIEAGNTETVTAGQPLVRLDPADTEVAYGEPKPSSRRPCARSPTVQNDALAADVDLRARPTSGACPSRALTPRATSHGASGGLIRQRQRREILHAEAA